MFASSWQPGEEGVGPGKGEARGRLMVTFWNLCDLREVRLQPEMAVKCQCDGELQTPQATLDQMLHGFHLLNQPQMNRISRQGGGEQCEEDFLLQLLSA